ncbi:MAG: hypothetical protein JNM18_05630, partial [Planctomycetaceae bacterium]|nr:hypothetical protein [Planctomycetaceae bacterium]
MGTFAENKSFSVYWYNKACDLQGAAAAVDYAMSHDDGFPRDDYGLSSGFSMAVACPLVYRMLWGMALEALFKAVILEKGMEI